MHISVQKIEIMILNNSILFVNIAELKRSCGQYAVILLDLTHSGTFFTIYHHHKPVQFASSLHPIFLLSSNCPSAVREDSLSNLNKQESQMAYGIAVSQHDVLFQNI